MILFLLVALLAAPLLPGRLPRGPALSRELDETQLRQRVDACLRSIDDPITPDEWRALGPRAAVLLEEIVRDPAALPTRRAQALWGLVALVGPSALPSLSALAGREEEPLVVRLAAVRALAALSPLDRLEATLRPLLARDAAPGVRKAAAEELARRCSAAVAPSTRRP